jgi:hypothetical protein
VIYKWCERVVFFYTKVMGLEGKLVRQGTYTFMWSMVNPKPYSLIFFHEIIGLLGINACLTL